MGDAADDAYAAAEAIDTAYALFMQAVKDSCSNMILGRKPCRLIFNAVPEYAEYYPEDDLDVLPYRCAHCGKEFDYP